MTQNAVRWSMVAGTAWLVGIAIGLVLQFAFVTFLRASGGDFVATLLSNLVFDLLLLLLAVRLLRRPTRTVLVVSLALALLSVVGPGWSPPGFEAWTWLSWLGAGIAGLASLAALIIARRGQLSSAREERPR